MMLFDVLKEYHQILNHKFLLYFELLAACIFLCMYSGEIEQAVCCVIEKYHCF